jgi:Cytochrome c oxidase subunit IIa family
VIGPATPPASKWTCPRPIPEPGGSVMPDTPSSSEEHPRGTLLLVSLYGLLLVLCWFGVYVFVYLRRGGVTP